MLKKIKFFGISVALLSMVSVKAFSYSIIIKFVIQKDSSFAKTSPVSDALFGIVRNNWDQLDQSSHEELHVIKKLIVNRKTLEIAIFKYEVPEDGIYCLRDLFGHEIFLNSSMKKDTILLKLYQIYPTIQKHLYLNDSIQSPWFFKIYYPHKYKFMGFFDSLAYLCGDIKVDFQKPYNKSGLDIKSYLSKIQATYQRRIQFLKNFNLRNPIPEKLKYLAFKEIQYSFYKHLLDPLETDTQCENKYPDNLKDTLNKIILGLNNNKLFWEVPEFKTVLLNYSLFGHDGLSIENEKRADSIYFIKMTDYCKKKLANESQAYVLAWLMRLASLNSSRNLFLISYYNYNKQKSTPGLNQLVDSLYNLVVLEKSFTPNELMNLSFEDKELKKQSLKTIFGKYKIAVIDCWATWCEPCREQSPHLEFFAKKYVSDVLFIALSADQFPSKWNQWLLNNNDSISGILNYHAPGGFNNVFFARQFINSIPRYILISSEGKILNSSLPFPSDHNAFERALSDYLAKKIP